MTSPTIRSIHADELGAWMGVARTALHGPPPSEDVIEARRKSMDLDRCIATFDPDGRMCGTARAFATELTVPGGVVPAAGVSAVGVLPTHRRQGHLRRMMEQQLADVAERGEPVAVLVAAEYPIYGRYGYGPTTEACGLRLTVPPSDAWLDAPVGRIELVDTDTFVANLLELYERARRRHPGHIVYDPEYWDMVIGTAPWGDDVERRRNAPKVLWRDETGQIAGAAMYSTDSRWENNRPQGELSADLVLATSDVAERELIRYLASVDWVASVRVHVRPIDHPLPLWLRDGRMATLVDRSDHIWARLLDVPSALAARRYGTTDHLVLELDDPLGYAHGRFALAGGPDGAECTPTDAEPDLRLAIGTLGAAYLGGQSWARLAAAGWVDEAREGALDRASAMFTTPRAPWCAFTF